MNTNKYNEQNNAYMNDDTMQSSEQTMNTNADTLQSADTENDHLQNAETTNQTQENDPDYHGC